MPSLCDLPTELKLMIFEHAILEDDLIRIEPSKKSGRLKIYAKQVGLLAVNRQIRGLVIPVFWGHNRFVISPLPEWKDRHFKNTLSACPRGNERVYVQTLAIDISDIMPWIKLFDSYQNGVRQFISGFPALKHFEILLSLDLESGKCDSGDSYIKDLGEFQWTLVESIIQGILEQVVEAQSRVGFQLGINGLTRAPPVVGSDSHFEKLLYPRLRAYERALKGKLRILDHAASTENIFKARDMIKIYELRLAAGIYDGRLEWVSEAWDDLVFQPSQASLTQLAHGILDIGLT
ncbi:MAG: hypothetical protein M1820_000758 [Bogoriella megaspora]|nr:MAG: hypothetical protein M1820_000758 [Bogoriella megaspora]